MPPKGKEQGAQANRPATGTRASARQAQPAAKTAAAAANKKANDEVAAAAPAAASASAQTTGTEPATVAKDEYDEILASNDPEALDAYFIEKFPKNEPDRDGKALDAYLAKEFPDDAQTDLKKRVLATYLKKTLFPNAEKPSEMKAEIDKVDAKVKAYYLLTLFRADVQGTLLNKPDLKFAELKVSDFERSDPKEAKIQKVVTDLNFPAPGWPYLPGTNFVLNDDILKTVYSNVVASRVQSLFENNKRGLPNKNVLYTLIGRLGSYYGLQRYPVDQQEPKGCIPKSDDETGRCDEHVVEKNLFRFALFGPQNEQNLVFEVSETNTNALLYAFNDEPYVSLDGQKKAFGRDDFPDKLKLAAYPFLKKAAQKLTDAKKNIGDGLSRYLKKYAQEQTMSDPAATPYGPGMPQQTEDPEKAKAAAAAAAEAAKQVPVAAAITTDKKGQSTDVPSAAEDAPATTGEAQDVKQTQDVVAPASDFIPFTGDEPSECKELVAQLRQYESQVQTLDNTLESFRTAASGAEKLIQQQQTLIEQLSALKGEKSALEGTQAEINAKLIACEGEKNLLQDRIKALEGEIDTLKKRIAELEAREAVLKNVIEKLVAAINIQQDKLNAIEDLLAKVDLQAKNLTEGDASQKIQELQDNLVTRADQIVLKIATLKDQLAAAQKNYDDLKAQFEALQKRLEECEGETGQKVTRLDALGKSEVKLREELKRCSDSHTTLLASYRKFCDDNKNFLTRVNLEMNRVVADFNSPLDALTKAIASGKEKLAAAEGNLPEGVPKPSTETQAVVEVRKNVTAGQLADVPSNVGSEGQGGIKSLDEIGRLNTALGVPK